MVAALFAAVAGLLLSAYAALRGRALAVPTPRELLGPTVAATAVVAGTVRSGYGPLTRLRRPA